MAAIRIGLYNSISEALAKPTFEEQQEAMIEIIKFWPNAPKEDDRYLKWMKDNIEKIKAQIPPGM